MRARAGVRLQAAKTRAPLVAQWSITAPLAADLELCHRHQTRMKQIATVVNYKTTEMTIRSAQALLPELKNIEGARVIVLDNDSQDGSYEKLVRWAADGQLAPQVEVWRSDRNGGFGYGCNY